MDTIKGIACLAVVLIHYNWGGPASNALKAAARFAVPYFFFVSGYYLPDKAGCVTAANTRRKAAHILKMAIICALIYAPYCVLWNMAWDSSWEFTAFLQKTLTSSRLIKFLLSSDPFVYGHFWYLLALLGCYFTAILLGDRPGKRGYFLIFLSLLCLYTAFGPYHTLLGLNHTYPLPGGSVLVIPNLFLLRAMPFFAFGVFLRKASMGSEKRQPFGLLLTLALLGTTLAVAEEHRLGTQIMYLGTMAAVLSLTFLSLWYPQKQIPLFAYIGDRLSMYVYLYHIAVGKLIDLAYARLHLWGNVPAKGLRPILVLVLSLLTAQLILYYKNQRSRRKTGA